ncbi:MULTISPECIES: hypothetical protein [Burkholderia]|uniref:Uncharacterized protein n=1 Tax=Burkholderia mayonis TaxID=1385591 RepID=A0A1B4FK09_9BURK|nr:MULTISPECIES: hypothetical protein [Burkholderia]AOJ03962.1 hypothetical protein WS70_18835 [Burkholderia mayonis]KVE37568.1 hypothetical protein WS69_10585 [Burkholderia sp. BDU5]KVE49198.1 hypothetical protein WS70_20215 [Burkholderia mayonis]
MIVVFGAIRIGVPSGFSRRFFEADEMRKQRRAARAASNGERTKCGDMERANRMRTSFERGASRSRRIDAA